MEILLYCAEFPSKKDMDIPNRQTKSFYIQIAQSLRKLPLEVTAHEKALDEICVFLNQAVAQDSNSLAVKTLLGIYHYERFIQGDGSEANTKKLKEYMSASVQAGSFIGWWFKDTCTKVNILNYSFTEKEKVAWILMKLSNEGDFDNFFATADAATLFLAEFESAFL